MAKLDQLIEQVDDEALRADLVEAAREIRKQQTFGLVFEEHIPETTLLRDFPIRPGITVYRRDDVRAREPLEVVSVTKTRARVTAKPDAKPESLGFDELLVVKRFGEPIYPSLVPVGEAQAWRWQALSRRDQRRELPRPPAAHVPVRGQGRTASISTRHTTPGPGTGSTTTATSTPRTSGTTASGCRSWRSGCDWPRLLRPDGVLIVTIDENEVHHLGMLLERLFPEYLRHMVSIVNNPKGTRGS